LIDKHFHDDPPHNTVYIILPQTHFFPLRSRRQDDNNPAQQDFPPAAGRINGIIPFRRSAIPRRVFILKETNL
jgi:hypothetical protein